MARVHVTGLASPREGSAGGMQVGPSHNLRPGAPLTSRLSRARQEGAEGEESSGNEHYPLLRLLIRHCIIFPLASLDRFIAIPLH